MIHIVKGEPLHAFLDFLHDVHPTQWDDIHRSAQYPNLGRQCREHILLEEQHMLGGYTERPLWNSTDLHIDHFRKKGMNWTHDVTWDWNNFIVEDRNPNYGACYKDAHTSDTADYALLLNPVTDYPERMLSYRSDGQITVRPGLSDDDARRADFTIQRFNLTHEKLRQMRESILTQIRSYEQLSDDEIREALQEQGFPSVVEWALEVRRELRE